MTLDSKTLLEAVFESTADGILLVDNNGKVIHSNTRFREMWRIPESLVTSGDDKKLLDFIVDQLVDPEGFIRRVMELYENQESMSQDTIAFKDGRYFSRSSRPLKSGGRAIGRVWSFLDITREKRSEEVFKAITDLSPDIISILSPEGTLTFNSPASERIHGYKVNELVGQNTFGYIHADDQALCQTAMGDLLSGKLPYVLVQYRYRNVHGEYNWMEATASNQIDNPLIKGIVVISREIGKRKKLEEDLQRALSNLENFISIVSHELKTPVTGIKLQLQMLDRSHGTFNDGKRSTDLHALIRQVNSLERLIDDLLQVSRLRRGTFTFEMRKENLSLILSENIQRFRSLLASSGCELETQIEDSIIVTCDRLRLEQVLINLISNAVRYAPGRPVKLRLSAEHGQALLRISDKGSGIDEEKKHHIFEPFGTASERRAAGGLGVGLFISRSIVNEHGGDLLIEDTSLSGTTFLLKLPLS